MRLGDFRADMVDGGEGGVVDESRSIGQRLARWGTGGRVGFAGAEGDAVRVRKQRVSGGSRPVSWFVWGLDCRVHRRSPVIPGSSPNVTPHHHPAHHQRRHIELIALQMRHEPIGSERDRHRRLPGRQGPHVFAV